ncbi:MAG TPA: hypothetical protein VLW85_18580 [Myxococcales bacterium]|nr:hypothetical protein [Myxococcales bacterium]
MLAAIQALAVALAAASAPPELVVVVHPAVAVQKLDAAQLESIFSSMHRTWAGGMAVLALNFPPEDALRVAFDKAVLRLDPDRVSQFWIDQRIRADCRPPLEVPDPAMALRLVARLPGAIGYLPAAVADGTVRVVARVRGGMVLPP